MNTVLTNHLRSFLLLGVIVFVCTGASLHVSASEISICTEARGTVHIDSIGLVLSASLTGTIEQSGSIVGFGHRIDFKGEGDFVGTGYRDVLSATVEAWAAYHITGSTSADQEIELLGLMYLHRVSASPLQVGDILSGTQYVLVRIDGSEQHFIGNFSGSLVEGGFVLSEAGVFLPLTGEASFALTGDSTSEPRDAVLSIPFPSSPRSRSFADHLRSTFPSLPWPVP